MTSPSAGGATGSLQPPRVPQGAIAVAASSYWAVLVRRIEQWIRVEGAWWATSFVFHMLLMCVLMFIGMQVRERVIEDEAPVIEASREEPKMPPPQLDHFELGDAPLEPTELTTETLTLTQPPGDGAFGETDEYYDDSPIFTPRGGGMPWSATVGPTLGGIGGFDIKGIGPGPAVIGKGGVGIGLGEGTSPGAGGPGIGFGGRGTGSRKAMVGRYGGTRRSERAVGAALSWIARHQLADGSWSLAGYQTRCKDRSCTGPGTAQADAGATALALLPFLAADQTHQRKGPYQQTVWKGLYWLMRNQRPDGNLAARASPTMYSHCLATIVLCEAYGLSRMAHKPDPVIQKAAQQAVFFIQSAQNSSTGGWRYEPGQEGDTSVVGWAVMALKSAQMAGLSVDPRCFEGAKQFLKSCSHGNYGGRFSYVPNSSPSLAMTAVGLLCYQYMGSRPDDPAIVEGMQVLMANLPDPAQSPQELYYWYYATQVMHNVPGPDWDKWNRQMRKTLIETQCKEPKTCAEGSWDPKDITWGAQGGRLFATSLSALTLEVYYRYLPLFKLDAEALPKPGAAGAAGLAPALPAAPGPAGGGKAPAEAAAGRAAPAN
ncbi:MAG: hypothetical protein ACUVUC_03895 [Thermoguttaceae bacterium]